MGWTTSFLRIFNKILIKRFHKNPEIEAVDILLQERMPKKAIITKENNFDNESNPYFIDMKLDVCIPNNDIPYIMDEDELKEALQLELISEDEYSIAYETAHKI